MAVANCGVLKNHYLQKYCKEKDSISVVENNTIEFDTLKVPYPVAGPTMYLENPCKLLCDSLGRLKPIVKNTAKNGIRTVITTHNNNLVVKCSTDSLMQIIKTQSKVIKTYEKTTQVRLKECERKHLSELDSFLKITGMILSGLLILIVLFYCFKTYLKTVFPFLGRFF